MNKTITKVSAFIKKMTRPATEKQSEKTIFAESLPLAARFFVQNNFPNRSIAFASETTTSVGTNFAATLNDGIQVEFNENGSWKTVDCNTDAVPATLVPSIISTFMDAYYHNVPLVKIEKVDDGYKVTLSNYATLKFKDVVNVA